MSGQYYVTRQWVNTSVQILVCHLLKIFCLFIVCTARMYAANVDNTTVKTNFLENTFHKVKQPGQFAGSKSFGSGREP